MRSSPHSAPSEEHAEGSWRALIVGVDPAMLRLYREVLEGAGFAVETAESGIAAVIAAREAPVRLILVAPQLPDVPGEEAMRWLRSNPALRTTPILGLSAQQPPPSPAEIRQAIRAALA